MSHRRRFQARVAERSPRFGFYIGEFIGLRISLKREFFKMWPTWITEPEPGRDFVQRFASRIVQSFRQNPVFAGSGYVIQGSVPAANDKPHVRVGDVLFFKRDCRQVAIKVMRPQIAAAMGAERFLREIEIAGSLYHPNILSLLDSGETDDLLYYVMPFIEGESLGERIERDGPLAVDDALQITRQVASALTYASGKGVIHRDIKPDNIMITADGHAVVMDFGIGKALEGGGEKLTQTGMSVGTPAYMSPEQAMGERDIDGRTDVYSLAAVVYEMLVGEQPFTGPTAQVIIAKRFSGQVPSARSRRDAVPPAMDTALHKALSVDRTARFSSADELVAAMTGEAEPAKASPAKRVGCGSTAAVLIVVLALVAALPTSGRSEARRVGKECRSRWQPYD